GCQSESIAMPDDVLEEEREIYNSSQETMKQKQNDTVLVITKLPQHAPYVVSNVSHVLSASTASTAGQRRFRWW
ncbi:hypothetical protein, partial [Acinetobacter baumannii]|uniref:hypothetical protein n=1 Tax=Acinetobacter baumannii TaxID=470 RepID=UPI00197A8357